VLDIYSESFSKVLHDARIDVVGIECVRGFNVTTEKEYDNVTWSITFVLHYGYMYGNYKYMH
jgi:hypothetical protein